MRWKRDCGIRNSILKDPVAVRAAVAASLRQDPGLISLLNATISYSPTILDIVVADHAGRALVSAPDPSQQDQLVPNRPELFGAAAEDADPHAAGGLWAASGL